MKAEYIDHMGTDLSVANAARVSFDKKSDFECKVFDTEEDAEAYAGSILGARLDDDYIFSDMWYGSYPVLHLSEADRGLINFLAKHNHWTPFSHTAITLRMKAPVPIRTQCFKHKVGFSENEESRRYIKSAPEVYAPDEFRAAAASVKQGSGGRHPDSFKWRRAYEESTTAAVGLYEAMIADGVCPEQARFVLPQGVMVNWIWTGSLAAYARFYRQRTDPQAQRESQDLAQAVGDIIRPLFPVSWAALVGGE